MMHIEVSLHGESPEFDELQRPKNQWLDLLVGLSGRLEEPEHPQPVALLPLNLSRDTLQMLAVIVQDCSWFGELITVEDTGNRAGHNIIVRPNKPFHPLSFLEYMIQVARGTKFIPAIPRYESPLNECRTRWIETSIHMSHRTMIPIIADRIIAAQLRATDRLAVDQTKLRRAD